MSTQNYGLGSRCMFTAGCMAIRLMMASFSSIATMIYRWGIFYDWCRCRGYRKMEKISREVLIEYGLYLANLVNEGKLSAATAQNYVSVVNHVFEFARHDREVWASPTKDCNIPKRSGIAKIDKSISPERHLEAQSMMDERVCVVMSLQRFFGFRFEESAKLNAKKALIQAKSHKQVEIICGSKGGRARSVPVNEDVQLDILEKAAVIQGNHTSMIPKDMSYAKFQRMCYRAATKAGVRFHTERHAYAQARYQKLTGVPCPVIAGIAHGKTHIKFISSQLNVSYENARKIDIDARQIIANELGHHRVGITNAYLG